MSIKVYDFFPFRNELSMLNARLHELDEIVDRFIIIESNKTFSNQLKELVYENHRNLFQKFWAKIIYIKIEDFPDNPATDIDREKFQKREGFLRGLREISDILEPNDLILSSDLDEIPRISTIKMLIENPDLLNRNGPIGFLNRFFYYHFRCEIMNRPWVGTVAMRANQIFQHGDMGLIRDQRGSLPKIENAGWHCSFFFSPEEIINKMLACPDRKGIYHTRNWDPNEIQKKIDNSIDLLERDLNDFQIKHNDDQNDPDLPKYRHLMFSKIE